LKIKSFLGFHSLHKRFAFFGGGLHLSLLLFVFRRRL